MKDKQILINDLMGGLAKFIEIRTQRMLEQVADEETADSYFDTPPVTDFNYEICQEVERILEKVKEL